MLDAEHPFAAGEDVSEQLRSLLAAPVPKVGIRPGSRG